MSASAKGYNISGRVLLDPYDDNGSLTGFLDPINSDSFQVSIPAPNEDTLIDNREGREGQLLGTRYIPKPPEITIKLNTFPPEMLAAQFMGLNQAFADGSGTATDLPITLIPGRWVQLPHRLINASGFAVTTAATPNVAIPDTDYELDREHGLIKYIGSQTSPIPALIDMGWGTLAGFQIAGTSKTVLKFAARVIGKNTANNKRCELDAPDILLYSDGLDMMTGKWINGTLKGRIQVPASGGSPFTYREF